MTKNEVKRLSLKERNVAMINVAFDIFEIDQLDDWNEVKARITNDRIAELYYMAGEIFAPDLTPNRLLPAPSSKTRALFLGETRSYDIASKLSRFLLYADQVVVKNPLLLPHSIAPDYNPLLKPGEFMADTIATLFCFLKVGPLVENDLAIMIPDPISFDHELFATWKGEVEAGRSLDISEEDRAELDERVQGIGADDLMRFVAAMPEEIKRREVERVFPEDPDAQRLMLKHWKDIQANDPFSMPSITGEPVAQLNMYRSGFSPKIALYVTQATGAFAYCETRAKSRLLARAAGAEIESFQPWAPLSKAFQELDFSFLNDVPVDFLTGLRKDGRLKEMRLLLRDLWAKVENMGADHPSSSTVKHFQDRLENAHELAKEDWKEIDQEYLGFLGAMAGATGMASCLISGGFDPNVVAGTFVLPATAKLLKTTLRRRKFRKTVPMTVFMDLEKLDRRLD